MIKNFISPVVITVKWDNTEKLALDTKMPSKSIHENKYEKYNIELIMASIQQNINAIASIKIAYFVTLDLKYAYNQMNLDQKILSIAVLR